MSEWPESKVNPLKNFIHFPINRYHPLQFCLQKKASHNPLNFQCQVLILSKTKSKRVERASEILKSVLFSTTFHNIFDFYSNISNTDERIFSIIKSLRSITCHMKKIYCKTRNFFSRNFEYKILLSITCKCSQFFFYFSISCYVIEIENFNLLAICVESFEPNFTVMSSIVALPD